VIYVKSLALIALIGSITWSIADPKFESILAVIGSLSTLVTAFLVDNRKARRVQQHQSVSRSSTGIQAGGNVNIGNAGDDQDVK
jgi:hypothetical protein